MSRTEQNEISFDEFDEINYPRPEETDFDRVVEEALSRRGFLSGGLALGLGAFVMGTSALTPTGARQNGSFGFEYRIEVFVPEAKRRYGYYVFPLLQGERFVGRIDMKHDRRTGRLLVKGLWPEAKCRWGGGRQDALEAELERLRRFTGAAAVVFEDGYLRRP